MAAMGWGSHVVAGGDEDSDSDGDGWDIGVERHEPQQLDQMLQADKNKALKAALFRSDVPLIEELLNSGISIESNFQFGWTPLMCAASMADFAVVRLLLDRGANACFQIDKYTVLMAACTAPASEEKVLKTVELLLSRNADPNLTCRKQMTPLMYAARKGYSQVVSLLVAHGSHINAQDENGYTALMWAAQQGHKNVILKLLELGADKNLQTRDEKTAADLAKINRHSEIYSLLSLAANHLEGRCQEAMKQEAIYQFLTAVPDHIAGSNSTFDDMEVFLHGIGLEHIMGLLKERNTTLRQLLIMQKDELIEIGITNPGDQQKLLDAINELQVEEIRIGDLPEVVKMELRTEEELLLKTGAFAKVLEMDLGRKLWLTFQSGDEFLKFLWKLNKECNRLTVPLQIVNKHFHENSHKLVLQWAPTESFIEVCKDLGCSIENLGMEVARLKDLIEKHEEKYDPTRVRLPEKAPTLEKRLVKMGTVTLLGFVFYFFITKLVVKKT